MRFQTLVFGKKRFVVMPESEFLRLQKMAATNKTRSDSGNNAMKELNTYRKYGKAASWDAVKRKLGL